MSAARSSPWRRRARGSAPPRQRGPSLLPAAAVVAAIAALTGGCAATGTAAQPQHPASHSQPSATAAAGSTARASGSPASTSPATSTSPSPRPASFPALAAVPPSHASWPQTRALPSAQTAAFRAEMIDLWAAVVSGKPTPGMRSFFPLGAYRQVKAIADPTSDWQYRLVADFRLDVYAAHGFVGRAARSARLVRVIVPGSEASWINPGVCYNDVGYWHVAGARIVYRVRHQLRSIGIASLISWRGRWYVVHFGAVLRGSAAGVVDQPSTGAGVTGPPGGC